MLNFITEDYLKDLYRKEPFTTYELNAGERLTPGGRQYLLDKGIKINSNLPTDNKTTKKNIDIKIDIKNEKENSLRQGKLIFKFRAIEALFLSCASELINRDLILAQKVVDIERSIKNIRKFIEGQCELENINQTTCDGCSDFECFEITDVYIHLKNSKEILNLYYLSCKLKEFKYEIIEEYEGKDDILDKVFENLDSLINILSRTICEAAGGIKCQRKK